MNIFILFEDPEDYSCDMDDDHEHVGDKDRPSNTHWIDPNLYGGANLPPGSFFATVQKRLVAETF